MPEEQPDEPVVSWLTEEENANRDYSLNHYGVVEDGEIVWDPNQTPAPPVPPPPPPVGPPPVPPVGDLPPIRRPKPPLPPGNYD